jgi:hypothetical protein
MTKKKQAASEENKKVSPYEPNGQERAALERHKKRVNNTPAAPKIHVPEGRMKVDHRSEEHGWDLLLESMGTTSEIFGKMLLAQLVRVSLAAGKQRMAEAEPAIVNFGLAVIAGAKPKDELEAMLATQMAAVHMATMDFATRLTHAETIQQRESAERTLNKLARTFTTQMEALKRYRGGEQRITVQHQHVTVNDGGQAVVGTVEQHRGQGEG